MSSGPAVSRAPTGAGHDLEVAVIGAGPHGLSAAIHLRRAGVDAHVFGDPMSFWRLMPEGMLLRSAMVATSMVEPAGPLSIASFAAATGRRIQQPVPLDDFIAYGLWVQRLAVPDVDDRAVVALDGVPHSFKLHLDDGTCVSAPRVVIAAGIAPFEHVPPRFDHLPPALVSHTAHHRDLKTFAGRRVAVVGGGQSAFEWAALMHERGAAQVEVMMRRPSVVWLRGHAVKRRLGPLGPIVYAPTDVGPLWYSRLVAKPDLLFRRLPRGVQNRIATRSIRPACSHFVRVRLGEIRISPGVEVIGADPRGEALGLSLSDGSTREVDHLMFGTGYDVDIARYAFLGERIAGRVRRVGGYPVLGPGLESSLPGLHIAGAPAAWSFGPIMRFVSGSWYAGPAITRKIAARRQGAPRVAYGS